MAGALTCTLPSEVLAGGKLRAKAALQLVNRSGAAITGAATVSLFLSTDETLDDADVAVGTPIVAKLKLPWHSAKQMPLKVSSLPDVPEGAYHLLAKFERAGAGSEVVASPNVIAVKPAVAELRVSLAGQGTGKGLTYVVPVSIHNAGNTTARGPATLSLSLQSADSGASIPVTATAQVKLNIKPGATLVRKIVFQLPAELPAGSMAPTVTLNVDAIPHAKLQSNDELILPAGLN